MSENGMSEVVEEQPKVANMVDEVDLYKCKYLLERRKSGQLLQQLFGERLERLMFDNNVTEEDIRKYDAEFQKKYGISLYKADITDEGRIIPKPSVVGMPRPV